MREWCVAFMAEKKTKRSHAGALGRAHEPQRRQRVQLLDRAERLVADRGGQVHDGVDPAQRVAERGRVGQVAQRDLDAHALVAEAALVAHQGAHGAAVRGQPAQQRGADGAGGAREKDHGRGGYALTALGSPCSLRMPGKRQPREAAGGLHAVAAAPLGLEQRGVGRAEELVVA